MVEVDMLVGIGKQEGFGEFFFIFFVLVIEFGDLEEFFCLILGLGRFQNFRFQNLFFKEGFIV